MLVFLNSKCYKHSTLLSSVISQFVDTQNVDKEPRGEGLLHLSLLLARALNTACLIVVYHRLIAGQLDVGFDCMLRCVVLFGDGSGGEVSCVSNSIE